MTDDPNLITEPVGTENGANDVPPAGIQPSHNNSQDTATGTNATPGTNAVGDENEDVEMTNLQGEPGQMVTSFGTFFKRGGTSQFEGG